MGSWRTNLLPDGDISTGPSTMGQHQDSSASSSIWYGLLSGMKPGKSGNEDAVHKPLLVLMILAQAQRGGLNRFSYEEIAQPLDEGIQRFGRTHQPGGSEMPFWHLKNDGFWIVKEPDSLPRRSNGDRPTKTGLLEHKAEACVRAELWEHLVGNPEL